MKIIKLGQNTYDIHPPGCNCGLCEPVEQIDWKTFGEVLVVIVCSFIAVATVVGFVFAQFLN